MNRKLIATVVVFGLLGSQAFAETDPARDIDEQWAARAKVQQQMQTHLEMMKTTMDKIQAESDPKARKVLMDEHMQEMRAMFGMMDGMHSNGMMPCCKMGGDMMQGHEHGANAEHKGAMPMCKDDTAQCQQMNAMTKRQAYMEREMGMMQMMMQQMMEHGAAAQGEGNHEHE